MFRNFRPLLSSPKLNLHPKNLSHAKYAQFVPLIQSIGTRCLGSQQNRMEISSSVSAIAAVCGILLLSEGTISSADEASDNDKDKTIELKKALDHIKTKVQNIRSVNREAKKISVGRDENQNMIHLRFQVRAPLAHVIESFLKELRYSKKYDQKPLVLEKVKRYGDASFYGFDFGDGLCSFQAVDYGDYSEVVFYKSGDLTVAEMDAIIKAYIGGWSVPRSPRGFPGISELKRHMVMGPGESSPQAQPQSKEEAIESLRQLGIDVYHSQEGEEALTWECMAGYGKIKQEIQDTLILALQNPEVYESIAKQTRCRYESNRPRAVLFEGPPGTGKTLTARIIAEQSGLPMVHIPVESVVSKWYGDSEKKMSSIFDACSKLDGAIIFIDEIDALATDRGSGNMHEASRRMLSVLLQKLEGFDSAQKTTLVCATNRKRDLDSALLNRFGLTIRFDLPTEDARASIFSRYARQLSKDAVQQLSKISWGLSCRDIKEICEQTERKWASKVVRKETTDTLPPKDLYIEATEQRLSSLEYASPAVNA